MSSATKWKKFEQGLPADSRTGSQVLADERRNAFDRHDARKNIAVSDDMAEKNRFQRKAVERQRQTEGTRNRFGDPVTQTVDAREKFEPTAGKKTPETEWRGKSVARSATGRPLDAELIELKKAADAERIEKMSPAARAKLGLPVPEKAARVKPTEEEIIAYCNFVIMAHPEVPLDSEAHPNDARWYQAVSTNVHNVKRCWFHLVKEKKVEVNLQGLLTAFQVCVDNNCFDYCKPRVRGENTPLINIIDDVDGPFAGESDELAVLRENIRASRARTERMRPATAGEAAEIIAARKKPFAELQKEIRAGYKRG